MLAVVNQRNTVINQRNIVPKSMYDTRKNPWDSLGSITFPGSTKMRDALHLADLDFTVSQADQFCYIDGVQIPTGAVANYRTDNGEILGTVGKRYRIVQNWEAFDFIDELLEHDIQLETAGHVKGSKVIWMLAKTPDSMVLGDKFENYLLFANSFDGTRAVSVCFTSIRVFCQNTMNLALKKAARKWSFAHKGDIASKVRECQNILAMQTKYNKTLNDTAEALAHVKIGTERGCQMVNRLFPINADMGDIATQRASENRVRFMRCLKAPDLADHWNGNLVDGWGFISAASDFAYHTEPVRRTKSSAEHPMVDALEGNKLLDTALKMLWEEM